MAQREELEAGAAAAGAHPLLQPDGVDFGDSAQAGGSSAFFAGTGSPERRGGGGYGGGGYGGGGYSGYPLDKRPRY